VVVAVPVASQEALGLLQQEADEVICLEAPRSFHAVGAWYGDFPQLSDAEVQGLLQSVSGRASKHTA
jgi:putative phosphoribosyl transferase